ncbi:MAG: hypothetical protein AAF614_00480 [Chloroflexota bacterium]
MRTLSGYWKNWVGVQVWLFFVIVGTACVPTTSETAVLPTLASTAISLDTDEQPLPTETATAAGRLLPPTSTPIPTPLLKHAADSSVQEGNVEETTVSPTPIFIPTQTVAEESVSVSETQVVEATSVQAISSSTITSDPAAWQTYDAASVGVIIRHPPELLPQKQDFDGLTIVSLILDGYIEVDTSAEIYNFTAFTVHLMDIERFEDIPNVDFSDPRSILETAYMQSSDFLKIEVIEPATMRLVDGREAATGVIHREVFADSPIRHTTYFVLLLLQDEVMLINADVATVDEAATLPIYQTMVDLLQFK